MAGQLDPGEVDGQVTGDSDGPPRAVLIAAIALAVAVVGIILVIAATRNAPPQAIAVPAVSAPQAGGAACRALTGVLPQQLGDYQRAPIAAPAPEGATAWRGGPGSEPVLLRCGLDRPTDFVVGSPIQVVDRVQWFEVADQQQSGNGAGRSTWYTVDRPVYLALTLPSGSGPTPIQQLSEVIDRTIAAVAIDPGRPG
jgi:hypothetical protein